MEVRLRQLAPGMVQQLQMPCSMCQGSGIYIPKTDRCSECGGQRVVPERKILEVQIDKGTADGHQIKFDGESDQDPDIPAGDIVFVVVEKEHSVFKRQRDDLIMEMVRLLGGAGIGLESRVDVLTWKLLHLILSCCAVAVDDNTTTKNRKSI